MTTTDLGFGASIGRYQIVRRLGAGGMAEVFLAHDPRLNRDVAIKILAGELVERPGYRLYLQREARAVAQLNHPHVAQVYDVLEFQDRACFVMEYLQGESLTERLRTGALSFQDTVRFGAQIATAVAHAHAHGILHCDLKPGNVFITTEGIAKVLDFGLARPTGHGSREPLTDVGASPTLVANRAGTPAYMPPELFVGQPLDERSDIYGLGLIVMEMATGRRPPPWPLALIPASPSETTRELHVEDPDVPPLLKPIIRKALAPVPVDRFQSALEMAAALESAGLRASGGSVNASDGIQSDLVQIRQRKTLDDRAPVLVRKREGLGRRILTTTAGGLVVAAAITLLGIINSAALNLTLGRDRQFASEGLVDWFTWGLRSIVAPGVLATAVLIAFVIAQSVVRFIGRAWFPRVTTSIVGFAQRSGVGNPVVLAQVIATCGTLALVAIYWRFNALIVAFGTDISVAESGQLARLGEDNLLEHRYYRMVLTLLTVVMIAALWRVLKLWRRERPSDGRSAVLAIGAVLTLAVLMLDVPYRILYQVDRFQVVRLGSLSCYALGETATELLVFCPLAPTPRNRTMRRDDPRLVRLDCYSRVFDPSTSCEPRQ